MDLVRRRVVGGIGAAAALGGTAHAVTVTPAETEGPFFPRRKPFDTDTDLTQVAGRPQRASGEVIEVRARVLDAAGQPVNGAHVEIWQCNAAGRYVHRADQHDAPLDPNFLGAGRTLTDAEGRYRFLTIRPGAYPWGNHPNAWRPAHIHFSLFGEHFASRLVTQMYFPGDPLLALDPIYQSTREGVRERLVSRFDIGVTEAGFALGFVFDIVLRGPLETPMETPR